MASPRGSRASTRSTRSRSRQTNGQGSDAAPQAGKAASPAAAAAQRRTSSGSAKRSRHEDGDAASSGKQGRGQTCFAEEDFTCAICWDLLLDPVVAPCGHDFCELCYQRWTVDQRKGTCPTCRNALAGELPGICRRLQATIEALFPQRTKERAAEVAEQRELLKKAREEAAREAAARQAAAMQEHDALMQAVLDQLFRPVGPVLRAALERQRRQQQGQPAAAAAAAAVAAAEATAQQPPQQQQPVHLMWRQLVVPITGQQAQEAAAAQPGTAAAGAGGEAPARRPVTRRQAAASRAASPSAAQAAPAAPAAELASGSGSRHSVQQHLARLIAWAPRQPGTPAEQAQEPQAAPVGARHAGVQAFQFGSAARQQLQGPAHLQQQQQQQQAGPSAAAAWPLAPPLEEMHFSMGWHSAGPRRRRQPRGGRR